jgi:hypothetical protein
MKKVPSALVWGVILVVVGVLSLLGNLDLLGGITTLVWGLVFALAGVAFLVVYLRDHDQWWALIPGMGGLGLGLLVAVGSSLPGDWEAVLFLGPLGLSFLLIYLQRRAFWWALIPAGVLLSVCAVVAASGQSAFDEGSLMLIGLGVTFGAVALLGKPSAHFRWAWIPGGILGTIGVLILLDSVELAAYVWPLAIIAVGAFFLLRATLGKPQADKPAEPPTPPAA